MPNIRAILRSGYYFGKLLFAGVHGLVYLKWRIWRAKHAFNKELTRCGVPKDAADMLTMKFNAQNKQLISSLLSSPKIGRREENQNPAYMYQQTGVRFPPPEPGTASENQSG